MGGYTGEDKARECQEDPARGAGRRRHLEETERDRERAWRLLDPMLFYN